MIRREWVFFISGVLVFGFRFADLYAKPADEQNEIILLNDSAAAVEDTDPELSKELTAWANDKEKAWEQQKAANNASPLAVTDKVKLQAQLKLINQAATEIGAIYPLIDKGLIQMAKDLQGELKNAK